ncbi:3412_t:CDS:2 [Rhizophagus irregularis]|nr:3412_t:CDS:2 [Rhizophagus irregularis]
MGKCYDERKEGVFILSEYSTRDQAPMVGDSLTAFSNGCCSELDFPLGRLGEIEEDDASGEFALLDLTFSLRTCSNGSSSEW